MTKQQKTEGSALTTETESNFLALQGADNAILAAVQEFGLDKSLLTRIKVPAGGGQFWEIETAAGVESEKTLEAIVVSANLRSRAWFRLAPEDAGDSTAPDCTSADGITGMGNPSPDEAKEPAAHECATCPFAQWGSDRREGGRGQDCSVRGSLVVFIPQVAMPVIVSIPRTSIKSFQKYAMQLAGSRLHPAGVVTALTLQKKQSGGNSYSVIEFRQSREVSPDELERITGLKETLSAAFG